RSPRAAGDSRARRVRSRRGGCGRGDELYPGRRGAAEHRKVRSPRPVRREPTTIRVRLGFALALALAPVLILSALQSTLNFQREVRERRANLFAAAERSAATARARIESAEVLLQTLAPGSVGFQCAPRLAEIKSRIPGYANLIRFDSLGRVSCAAASVPPDPERRLQPWF